MRLFWITFMSLGVLAGSLTDQETDPELFMCWDHIYSPMNNSNIFEHCSSFPDNFTICPKSIYYSENLYDQIIVKNINIQNSNKAYKYICSNQFNMGDNEHFISCLASGMKPCIAPYVRKLHLNCVNDIIPCLYKTMSKCSLKGTILVSKALTMIKSTACTLSSYQYKLKPFYGPEIDCYPEISNSFGIASAKLGPKYDQFCAEFQKENVSRCIDDTLLAKNYSFLLDDDYIKEANEFFRRRSELCKYFSHSKHKTCPSVDVVSCQEDLFKKEALQKPFDILLRSYAECVYDKYKTCDTTLAKIIKYNLDGIKSNALLSLLF